MGLTSDQQRIKALLTETITLLCKNGLHFKSEFSIEGLIGITLDQDDVFLISIKETVKSDAPVGKTQFVSKAIAPVSSGNGVRECQRISDVGSHCESPEITNNCVSHFESEQSQQMAVLPNTKSLIEEGGDASKRFAAKKRRRSPSPTSVCPKNSTESHCDFRTAVCESGVTNSFAFVQQPEVGQSFKKTVDVHHSQTGVSYAGVSSKRKSDHSAERDVVNVRSPVQRIIKDDEDSFEVINIKEESDDEIESSYVDTRSSSHQMYNGAMQKNYGLSNEFQQGYEKLPQNGCSFWNDSVSSPSEYNSLPESIQSSGRASMKAFKKQPKRRQQLRRPTSSNNVVYRCPECSRILTSPLGLKQHINSIHRSIFSHSCQLCGKGFTNARDLRGHLSTRHNMKKEFQCKLCGREFGYKRSLKEHSDVCTFKRSGLTD